MIIVFTFISGVLFILIGLNILKIKWKVDLTENEINNTKITLLICGAIMIIGSIVKFVINI